jgi:hypothetical protein
MSKVEIAGKGLDNRVTRLCEFLSNRREFTFGSILKTFFCVWAAYVLPQKNCVSTLTKIGFAKYFLCDIFKNKAGQPGRQRSID